jgi:hypothetical protein
MRCCGQWCYYLRHIRFEDRCSTFLNQEIYFNGDFIALDYHRIKSISAVVTCRWSHAELRQITAIAKNESDTWFSSNDEHAVPINESVLLCDNSSYHFDRVICEKDVKSELRRNPVPYHPDDRLAPGMLASPAVIPDRPGE